MCAKQKHMMLEDLPRDSKKIKSKYLSEEKLNHLQKQREKYLLFWWYAFVFSNPFFKERKTILS